MSVLRVIFECFFDFYVFRVDYRVLQKVVIYQNCGKKFRAVVGNLFLEEIVRLQFSNLVVVVLVVKVLLGFIEICIAIVQVGFFLNRWIESFKLLYFGRVIKVGLGYRVDIIIVWVMFDVFYFVVYILCFIYI